MKVIYDRNSMIELIIVELLKLNHLRNGAFGCAEIDLFCVTIVCVVFIVRLVIESLW
jgi:hypothetical protein